MMKTDSVLLWYYTTKSTCHAFLPLPHPPPPPHTAITLSAEAKKNKEEKKENTTKLVEKAHTQAPAALRFVIIPTLTAAACIVHTNAQHRKTNSHCRTQVVNIGWSFGVHTGTARLPASIQNTERNLLVVKHVRQFIIIICCCCRQRCSLPLNHCAAVLSVLTQQTHTQTVIAFSDK